MGNLFAKLFGKKDMRILMLGLDAAGKTSILHVLIDCLLGEGGVVRVIVVQLLFINAWPYTYFCTVRYLFSIRTAIAVTCSYAYNSMLLHMFSDEIPCKAQSISTCMWLLGNIGVVGSKPVHVLMHYLICTYTAPLQLAICTLFLSPIPSIFSWVTG